MKKLVKFIFIFELLVFVLDGLLLILSHQIFVQKLLTFQFIVFVLYVILFNLYSKKILKYKIKKPNSQNIGCNFIILSLLVISFVFWRWLLPFPNVASDLHTRYNSNLFSQFTPPQTWFNDDASGLGQNNTIVLWSWPVNYFFGFMGRLGVSYTLLVKVFLFVSLYIGLTGIIKLTKREGMKSIPSWIAGLFYISNTYFLLLVDGGQINFAIAYLVIPYTFLAYRESIESRDVVNILRFTILVLLISVFDIRVIYLLFLLIILNIFFNLIFDLKRGLNIFTRRILIIGSIVGSLIILVHAYWIIPTLVTKQVSFPVTYTRSIQLNNLSFANIGNSILLLQPNWFLNVFGKVTPILPVFIFIPILVFLSPFFVNNKFEKKKAGEICFWLIIALIGAFLVKGSNPLLPNVYPWLFANIPGFSLFRDPTKFYFFVTMAYSILIGFSVEELSNKLKWNLQIVNLKIPVIPLIIVIYLLSAIFPIWLGKMTGTFSPPDNKSEFINQADIFENDKSFGRIFYIPTVPPLGYSSPTHPSLEAIRMVSKRPFGIATVGSYEQLNFIREGKIMGELFDIAGVKYVSFPYPDTRREDLKKDNIDYYYQFLDQISSLPWIDNKITNAPVPLLQTKKSSDHLFLADKLFYIVGSDRIYNDLIEIPGFELRNNAMLFAEEAPENSVEILNNPDTKIIMYDKDGFDLTASIIPRQYFVFPADSLGFDPDKSGWWKRETSDFLSWRVFLQEKYGVDYQEFDYGGGVAVGEGNKELNIKSSKFHKGDVVFVRVLGSAKGGSVSVEGGPSVLTSGECFNKIIIKLSGYKDIPGQEFNYDCSQYFWINAGVLSDDGKVDISVNGEINVINAIISIPQNTLNGIAAKVPKDKFIYWNKLTESEKGDLFENVGSKNPLISFTRLSPTHFKANVSGVKKPTVLVFSENFDNLWKLNGEPSTNIYSLINGFVIEKDGEYDLYYEAQKYVIPGLIISGITLITLIGFYVISKKSSIEI